MKVIILMTIILALFIFSNCSVSKKNSVIKMEASDYELSAILQQYPQFFDSILKRKDDLNVQVIYTQIDRKKNGKASFKDFYFNVNENNYFYPASTVKFPVAVLALQKLNELKIAGLDKNTTMITETDGDEQNAVYNDPSAHDGKPTIALYIKKILLVSDNDAFNRLYEFLGQEYINNNLHKMGYANAQIIHRLSINLSEEQNRHSNPVKFYDNSGKIIYEKPAEKSRLIYAKRNTKLGTGYISGNTTINEPFDFSKKNRLSITDLHNMLRSVMFPESVSKNKRFHLTASDYEFLHKYMSMLPRESKFPAYDTAGYWDTYVKFLFYGSEKVKTDPGIRIFNKVGDAYGFLIDAAYFADFNNKVEFMISAVIYCNSDGIFNDDKYDYDTIGYPFFKHLGQGIYDHEIKRKRTHIPDLSTFQFNYEE
jgi:Beta-lactamase enzyme family